VPSTGESIVFDRAAGYYDATRGFPPGVEARVADLFAQAGGLGPRSRVLEVGIGTGRIAVPLAARVARYAGADLSAPMLAQLVAKRGALPIDLVRADAGRLPFAERSFDAVIGVHVFHLIPGWRDALAGAARLLRPDGLLLHGGDDHMRGAVWRRWRDRVEERGSAPNVGVPRARIESFPEDEGWRPAGVHRIAFARRLGPRTMLELVSGRSWSMTWRMGDAELADAVEALRADLLDAYGDLDREVEVETGFWLRAYRPPEVGAEA
jgi:ubiquinone/menaquinone biosynthesis C-methylase UbiE